LKPYYLDDWVTIYHGDCREIMPQLDVKVDLIPTSPPYNCRKAYPSGDELPWPVWYAQMKETIKLCYDILQVGGVLAINLPGVVRWQSEHSHSNSWGDFDPDYKTHRNGEKVIGKGRVEPIGFEIYLHMRKIDSHVREPIIWVKGSEGNAICSDYRMGCDSDPYMRPAHEMILLGSKGRWFHRGGTGRRGRDAVPFMDYTKDVWFITPESDSDHPTVYPKELPMRLIKLFTHAEDSIILDPFFGRGSTGLASKEAGRHCIGIEIEEKYCEISAKRCSQQVMELSK